jgi:hypothetical protein
VYANEEPESCLLGGDRIDFQYQAASSRLTLDLPVSESLRGTLQIVF